MCAVWLYCSRWSPKLAGTENRTRSERVPRQLQGRPWPASGKFLRNSPRNSERLTNAKIHRKRPGNFTIVLQCHQYTYT